LTGKSLGKKQRSLETRMALIVSVPVVRVRHMLVVVKQRFMVVGMRVSFR
jgi:hypothetical protein